MAAAPQSYDLPKTAQPAPPNFYSQAGQQGQSQGQGQGAGGSDADAQPDDKHKFIKLAAGILTDLQKMQELKVEGVNTKKYIKAAATAIKDALMGGKGQKTPDEDSSTGDGGDIPSAPDQPLNASPSAAGSAAGGAGGPAPTAV